MKLQVFHFILTMVSLVALGFVGGWFANTITQPEQDQYPANLNNVWTCTGPTETLQCRKMHCYTSNDGYTVCG